MAISGSPLGSVNGSVAFSNFHFENRPFIFTGRGNNGQGSDRLFQGEYRITTSRAANQAIELTIASSGSVFKGSGAVKQADFDNLPQLILVSDIKEEENSNNKLNISLYSLRPDFFYGFFRGTYGEEILAGGITGGNYTT